MNNKRLPQVRSNEMFKIHHTSAWTIAIAIAILLGHENGKKEIASVVCALPIQLRRKPGLVLC